MYAALQFVTVFIILFSVILSLFIIIYLFHFSSVYHFPGVFWPLLVSLHTQINSTHTDTPTPTHPHPHRDTDGGDRVILDKLVLLLLVNLRDGGSGDGKHVLLIDFNTAGHV